MKLVIIQNFVFTNCNQNSLDDLNHFRCSTIDEKPCEDVTLGDCQGGAHWEENILKIIDGISVTECQGACVEYADCVTYRFSYPSDSEQSHCWLLVYDYRQECRNSAAPKVKELFSCVMR